MSTTENYFKIGKDDMIDAELLLINERYRNAIYLVQQGVEKCWKGLILKSNDTKLKNNWCRFKNYDGSGLSHTLNLNKQDRHNIETYGFLAFINDIDLNQLTGTEHHNLLSLNKLLLDDDLDNVLNLVKLVYTPEESIDIINKYKNDDFQLLSNYLIKHTINDNCSIRRYFIVLLVNLALIGLINTNKLIITNETSIHSDTITLNYCDRPLKFNVVWTKPQKYPKKIIKRAIISYCLFMIGRFLAPYNTEMRYLDKYENKKFEDNPTILITKITCNIIKGLYDDLSNS